MALALQILDSETIKIIVLFAFLLILALLVIVITRRFSKKAMRTWLKDKGDQSHESDKAFNSLLAVKVISKNFEGQGLDVTPVKKLIEDSERKMKMKNYDASIETTETAKAILMELKAKKDSAGPDLDRPGDADIGPTELTQTELAQTELAASAKDDHSLTAKEMIQKRYPQSFLQSKFTIGLAESLLESSRGRDLPLEEAKSLLEKSKDCFNNEDYENALQYSIQCKRLLEGESVEPPVQGPTHEAIEKHECPQCKHEAKERDVFCRRCGYELKG
jgi:hypothetical protein